MVTLRRKTRRGRSHRRKYTGSRRRQRPQRSQRQRGGARLAGHVNEGILNQEKEEAKRLMQIMAAAPAGEERFKVFKTLVEFNNESHEIMKDPVYRRVVREKINEFYALGLDYINKDEEYAELVQSILLKINDLDARGMVLKLPN